MNDHDHRYSQTLSLFSCLGYIVCAVILLAGAVALLIHMCI